MSTRRYLVTGGFGFLGAPLVHALVAGGHAVRVLDNGARGSAERLDDVRGDVEILVGDVRDPDTVHRAVTGVDAVCHLASVNGTRYFYEHPASVLDVGVRGMLNVLDACLRADVGELVVASSSEVYQTPPQVPTDERVPLSIPDIKNPRYSYAGAKIITELMALHYGREYLERVVVFRPHNVFGPDMGREHVIPQFAARLGRARLAASGGEVDFPIQGSGDQTRAFIYVEDFVRALGILLARGEHLGIYNIGTEEELTIRDVAQRVARCLGLRIRVIPGPEAPGGPPRRCPDISALRALGFRPRVTFDEGLRATIPWYEAHPLADEDGVARVSGIHGHAG